MRKVVEIAEYISHNRLLCSTYVMILKYNAKTLQGQIEQILQVSIFNSNFETLTN
jgi:hypothetical protein